MREPTVPRPMAFRAIMGALGSVQLINGAWALLAPHSFYDDFPPGRGGWVSALPAYNEHLLRDVGSLFLGSGIVLVVAAVWLQRRVVVLALASYLAFSVPHTIYHLFNLGPYGTGDAVANAVTLIFTVLAPAALLALLMRPAARPATSRPAQSNGARIAGVERSRNPLVRYAYRRTRRQMGRVVEPVKVTAHHPLLLAGWGTFELATEHSHRVDKRVKELAVLKAAQLAGCEWCMDFGSALIRSCGVSEDELRALTDYRASDLFSEQDKLVLDYAVAMTRTPVDVSDELFAALRTHFDEPQLVELTSVIALENYRGRFNWALAIGSEGFSEGAYCVRPQSADATAGAAR